MSLETNVLKNGLTSYTYKFRYHGRTYRGHLGPISPKDAKLAERKARVQAAEGTHPLPKRQQRRMEAARTAMVPTFDEFAPKFLASYGVDARPRSVRTYQDRLNLHLLRYLGDQRLDAATTELIDLYRTTRRQEGAAPTTINGELAALSCLLQRAAEWKIIPKSSLGTIHWLRVEERAVRVLSAGEVDRLVFSAAPRLRSLIKFALQTGLRKMELLTLTWADIDLQRREVTVVAHRAKNRHRRVVPLNRDALVALKDARSRDGRVFGYHSISAPMDRAAKKAGMPGVNCHVLRKTFATRCLEAEINVRTLQRWLGHESLSVTQKYVNPSDVYERQAIELLRKPSHQISTFVESN